MKVLYELIKLTTIKSAEVKEVSFDRYIPELNTARCIIRFKKYDYYCTIRPSDMNPGMYQYWDCNSEVTDDDVYLNAEQLVDVILTGYKYFVSKQ